MSTSLSLVLSSPVNALEQLVLLSRYQYVLLGVAFCELDPGFSIWSTSYGFLKQFQPFSFRFPINLSKRSSWAKSLSLTVFVFGTDVVSVTRVLSALSNFLQGDDPQQDAEAGKRKH